MRSALYVVVREDLSPGQQLAQVAHAVFDFAVSWKHTMPDVGDTVVILSVPDEAALTEIVRGMPGKVPLAAFHEPDLGGQMTAAAFGAGAGKRLARLPLAGRVTRPAA